MPGTIGKGRIIVALDVFSLAEADHLVEQLSPYVGLFKVGLQLITAEGAPRIVDFIHQRKSRVFFDGKFCDIPNTIGKASKAVSELKACMFNVHASCGVAAMKAAVANRGWSQVLAVTVLTSLEENEANLIFGQPSKAKVIQMAQWAKMAGVQGIICSPKELMLLKARPELIDLDFVTPGIRPEWAAKGDQARVTTPFKAVKAGVEYMVIGRPITQPPKEIGSPVEAAQKIIEEIQTAEKELGIKPEDDVIPKIN
ncbi:MAG: orotidine-5'-phosphate decarboxylase [Candidatus Buchananbacteria bacterium]|nr:orotidine-5'-phosphate decarboxylase [Candidatus Buchananbacteria bacterium]